MGYESFPWLAVMGLLSFVACNVLIGIGLRLSVVLDLVGCYAGATVLRSA